MNKKIIILITILSIIWFLLWWYKNPPIRFAHFPLNKGEKTIGTNLGGYKNIYNFISLLSNKYDIKNTIKNIKLIIQLGNPRILAAEFFPRVFRSDKLLAFAEFQICFCDWVAHGGNADFLAIVKFRVGHCPVKYVNSAVIFNRTPVKSRKGLPRPFSVRT